MKLKKYWNKHLCITKAMVFLNKLGKIMEMLGVIKEK